MADEIPVPDVKKERTHVGRVKFPTAIPEGLLDHVQFPEDIGLYASDLGLSGEQIAFLLAVLRGRGAVTAAVDLPDLAKKTGLEFNQMDEIIRDLIEKNYARLDKRLDLYRFWICLLHVKGIEFVKA